MAELDRRSTDGVIIEKLDAIHARLGKLDDRLERVENTLNGEGERIGMKGRLVQVEQTLRALRKGLWFLAGVVAAILVPTIIAAIK